MTYGEQCTIARKAITSAENICDGTIRGLETTIAGHEAVITDLRVRLDECLEGHSTAPVSAGAILLDEVFTPEGLAYGVEHGAHAVPCLFQVIDGGPPHDGIIDEEKARLLMSRRAPDGNYDGPLILDIEEPLFSMFLSDDPAVRYKADRIALSNVAFLRYLRPFAKIAWWGWPNVPWRIKDENGVERNWPNVSEAIREKARAKLRESKLGGELDWLFPAGYLLWGEPNEWCWGQYTAWATDTCELAAEIADGRAVALCTSPRSQLTYPGRPKVLLPMNIWQRLIRVPIDAGVGVGWWDNAKLTPEQEIERIAALLVALESQ